MADPQQTSIERTLPIGWPLHNPHGLVITPIHGTNTKRVVMRIQDMLGRRIKLHVDEKGHWADIRVETV